MPGARYPDFLDHDPNLGKKLRDLVRELQSLGLSRNQINVLVEVTAAYNVASNARTVVADATGGAFAVTLPFAADRYLDINDGQDNWLVVKRVNAGGNAITVTAQAGDDIDGAATKTLGSQHAAIAIVPDGDVSWRIFGLVGTVT